MAEKMKVVRYSKYGGGAEALEYAEVPIPTPKKGEILVKIEAVSVNPVDYKIQNGFMKPILPSKFPYIPGTDISGEVLSIGSGVNGFQPGDKVVSWLDISAGGGFAQVATATLKTTVKRPQEVSAVDGACLPVAGITALQSLRDSAGVALDGCYKGNILITAASGGVGTFAVQIAKLGGAHVTATCGARNIDLLKSLGADEVLDYKTSEGAQLISPSGRKYDAVINCASGIPWSHFQKVLAPRGKVIELSPSFKGLLTSAVKKVTFSKQKPVPFFMSANSKDLQILVDLVKEGKLKPVIDSEFPLERAKDAWHKSVEGHATGKIVIICA
ncbi:hypothetical protein O6H91_13G073300 [Diphasiastrum complanatum]|uniref:Uncharacterized protein n=1 Tax=Diphasiastrum complanatum TaxID=34168 RepID=A0ACC2BW42_DIPCM|nr:hypothetical protein O6H91_13G073300 [Diphasiastrum complanatum]